MRPAKRTKRLPVKLTLDPGVRANAELLPDVIDRGLSALVERLLQIEIGRHARRAKPKAEAS
jgi:hypothetical protein